MNNCVNRFNMVTDSQK